MSRDRFGNELAAGLPYARGRVLTSTEDDFRKVQQAWRLVGAAIAARGPDAVFNFTGLEHGLPLPADELAIASDHLAPALYFERFRAAAIAHLGGSLERHDAALFNRLTGATVAALMILARPGDTVIGVTPSYSHPSVVRAVANAGARFVETRDVAAFETALAREPRVSLVVLTRLAVTYELLPTEALHAVIRLAHARGVPVYVDDAGGARVGPALSDQPRMLTIGADLVATGLDKYGTLGPRLGVLAGDPGLVGKIRARAIEFGMEARPLFYPAAVHSLEQYRPERVRELVACTREVAAALRPLLGRRLRETPVIAELLGEDILEVAMERAGLDRPPIVPIEATAALAMLLLHDHGMMTVHFVGVPPGTSALMIKFIPRATLARFGGPPAFAKAIDASLGALAAIIGDEAALRALLFGA